MTEFASFRSRTYPWFIDDGSGHKKAKETKKCVIKEVSTLKTIKNAYKVIE